MSIRQAGPSPSVIGSGERDRWDLLYYPHPATSFISTSGLRNCSDLYGAILSKAYLTLARLSTFEPVEDTIQLPMALPDYLLYILQYI